MAKDIVVDSNNDLEFLDGDFFVNECGDQHIQHHLQANKGQYYESPLVGVGIASYLNGPFDRPTLLREIREQLQADGFNIRRIEIGKNNDQLEVDIDAIQKDNTSI